MAKLVVNNVSGDSVLVLGELIADQESYEVPDIDLVDFAKDAYLRILCIYGLCSISVYDLELVQDTARLWLSSVATANIIYT